ncbi:hypothetical protein FAUST_10126 [Fusarium austroamericanum]|uniref:Uncharacterized protein n=1 Tax=Fusarium austroamericanum TaxID=282268 RepID=A0AAN5Z2D5_FUSAU|nr:hypothetical protein FAUST_10126 [Fusarium austroamericanum]
MIGLVPPSEFKFCVYVKPVPAYHGLSAQDALILMSFDRAAPHGLGHAKVGGNYAPVIKWSEQAKADGFGMTLHLDSKTRTEIDEFSTSGFLGIKVSDEGAVTVVAPSSPCIIDSTTSDCCLQLARHYGWKVEKRPIKYTELPEFSEVVAVGTAASVVSIRSITLEDSRETVRYLDATTKQGRFLAMNLGSLECNVPSRRRSPEWQDYWAGRTLESLSVYDEEVDEEELPWRNPVHIPSFYDSPRGQGLSTFWWQDEEQWYAGDSFFLSGGSPG